MHDVTDPRGLVKRASYDLLGRTIQTVEAYDGGVVTADTNRTTRFAYDGANHLVLYTAIVSNSGTPVQVQQTAFIYGVAPSGSSISSNDLLAATQFPDKTTGAPSSSEQEIYTYNALGDRTGFVDRNGTGHSYTFDVLGRQTADAVRLATGTDVDDAVLLLTTEYDAQGNAWILTSYDAVSSGTIVNQVVRMFNGLGQLIREYQSHNGESEGGVTPYVDYTYSEMASGANHSRPTSVVYPSGFTLSYANASGLNSAISRLTSISDGSTTMEEYSYLGLGALVVRAHEQHVNLTYVKQSGESDGDAGDKYIGLDRFGRVVDQRWIDSSVNALDRFQYLYDRNSNRLYRDNLVQADFGELYHASGSGNGYDNLNQLAAFERGKLEPSLTGGPLDTVSSPSRTQVWTMDPQGNFPDVTTDSVSQTRTHNRQNELTGVDSAALTFDANGNMIVDELGNELTYDAWNRLVKVEDSGSSVLAEYAHDALTRRVIGYGVDLYYSQNWQVLEDWPNGEDWASARYVWSIAYIDAMVLRDYRTSGSGSFTRHYALCDANWNITSIADLSGAIAERYIYDPYGLRSVLGASFKPRSPSSYGWVYGHQGGRLDVDAGLYSFRYRDLSPTLMRWMTVDPIGYEAGVANVYRIEGNSPAVHCDRLGLQSGVGAADQVELPRLPYLPGGGEGGLNPWRNPIGQPVFPGDSLFPGVPYTPGGGFGGMHGLDRPKGPATYDFELCKRKIQANDSSDQCIYACAGLAGIEHVYIQYGSRGFGFSGGGPGQYPKPERHFKPSECTRCKRSINKLRHGKAADRVIGTNATNEQILDCIQNSKTLLPYNKLFYNCITWANHTAADCGLDCSIDPVPALVPAILLPFLRPSLNPRGLRPRPE